MTISYTIQPIPFWYFADLNGEPLAGGKLYSYSSLNPNLFKPIYQDPSGINQYPNPILFDATGTIGPLYFKLDSTAPDDLYFLQIFDIQNNLVRQIQQYPISGSGSGGSINTVQNIENILVNSSFINNSGKTTIQPISDSTFLVPSAHSGLYFPDITYIQSGTSNAQDTISFSLFTSGTNPISPDFSTPYYINYDCLNNPTGEVYKGIRIPISQFVNNVSNQIFTFNIYARANSGANTINVQFRQYFGTGGSPSTAVVTNLTPGSITLTSSFALYTINFSVPSIFGKILSNSNDDGSYIEILFPTGASCSIDLCKPSLYAGSIFPNISYESVEEIEAKIETPRSGDIRTTMNAFSTTPIQNGWIPLNDGTIGNSFSNSTTRADSNTWLLYNIIWNGSTSTDCPIYNSSGNPVSKGGSSLADWNSNNQIQLPLSVGKVSANRGSTGFTANSQAYTSTGFILTVSSTTGFRTGYPVVLSGGTAPDPLVNGITYFAIVISATTMSLATSSDNALVGTYIPLTTVGNGTITNPPTYALAHAQGETVHIITEAELASHSHPGSTVGLSHIFNGDGSARLNIQVGGSTGLNIAPDGGNVPHNTISPQTFYNMIIKL